MTPVLSIDEGQLGAALVWLASTAATERARGEDTTATAWLVKDLADRLVAWQMPCGGWTYYPDRVQAPNAIPHLNQQVHYDDGGVSSVTLGLLRAYMALGDEAYLASVRRAFDHARLCQSRSVHGGIPGSASPDGYALQQRTAEPAGCDSVQATALMASVMLFALENGMGRDGDRAFVERAVKYFFTTEKDGNWPRYTLAYADKPLPVFGSTKEPYIVFDVKDAEPGYAWYGKWPTTVLHRVKE
jgi:hypothetical protein